MVRPARTFDPTPGHRARFLALLEVYRAEREAMMQVWELRKQLLA